jgi:excisionase family DNA binding protein
MAEETPVEGEDRWLTLAEVAAELRMSPATIRSWVSQGTVQATRAGKRKWLVRRSELDRMLARDGVYDPDSPEASAPEGGWREVDTIEAPHRSPHWSEAARQGVTPGSWLRFVDNEWRDAVRASATAPPDQGFPARLRAIAEAAARKASALVTLDQEPGKWWRLQKGIPSLRLSYELRPGANRPGPSGLWTRFDAAVERLSEAMEAHSVPEEEMALVELSLVLHEIADSLVDLGVYPWPDTQEYDRADGSSAESADQDAAAGAA